MSPYTGPGLMHKAMLPLNLRPEHYMFLLTVSKNSYAGSRVPGARLFTSSHLPKVALGTDRGAHCWSGPLR